MDARLTAGAEVDRDVCINGVVGMLAIDATGGEFIHWLFPDAPEGAVVVFRVVILGGLAGNDAAWAAIPAAATDRPS